MNLRHAAALAIVTWYFMLPRASLHAAKVLVLFKRSVADMGKNWKKFRFDY
jgi:hypothetical protein